MKKVQHMVVVKFKPGQEAKAGPLLAALAELPKRIGGILHYGGGPYKSPEGLNQGYTHGFLFTFENALARDLYLSHTEHVKVVAEYLPSIESVMAFDFEE